MEHALDAVGEDGAEADIGRRAAFVAHEDGGGTGRRVVPQQGSLDVEPAAVARVDHRTGGIVVVLDEGAVDARRRAAGRTGTGGHHVQGGAGTACGGPPLVQGRVAGQLGAGHGEQHAKAVAARLSMGHLQAHVVVQVDAAAPVQGGVAVDGRAVQEDQWPCILGAFGVEAAAKVGPVVADGQPRNPLVDRSACHPGCREVEAAATPGCGRKAAVPGHVVGDPGEQGRVVQEADFRVPVAQGGDAAAIPSGHVAGDLDGGDVDVGRASDEDAAAVEAARLLVITGRVVAV